MRTPFIAGNWKMNTSKRSAIELARAIAAGVPDGVDLGIAPPFVYIDAVGQVIAGSKLLLGAQDCYHEKNAAFTGEISCEMLLDLGVQFCLSGHSERRNVLNETHELVARKSATIYANGLILIHCVGEKSEERDAGQTLAVVQKQLDELETAKIDDPDRLVIAYEPVWAIGTGRVATDDQAQEVHAFIRQAVAKRWNPGFADRVRIQYGGSAKPENIMGLIRQPDIDGGLIGGAALKADTFLALANLALQK